MGASDGEIGKVKDFYFDDHTWTLRYIIVETGGWLSGRKVLISPESILKTDWDNQIFPVNLTMEQIKQGPDIDTDQPVSRQQEIELNQHYPWTNYWGLGWEPGGLWGGGIGTTGMMIGTLAPLDGGPLQEENNGQPSITHGDPQLRSYQKIKGYSITATDGSIGDVEDIIVDDSMWRVEMLVVDTGHWLAGKKVLISPKWIKEIDWAMASVVVNVSTDKVKNSPEYDSSQPVTEDYHTNLHNHYGNQA